MGKTSFYNQITIKSFYNLDHKGHLCDWAKVRIKNHLNFYIYLLLANLGTRINPDKAC